MERDRSIDAIKGLAIVLVVAGHAISLAHAVDQPTEGLLRVDATHWIPLASATGLLISFIYSFHMPLFAFASGYVLGQGPGRSVAKTLGVKARSLLLPYLSWFAVLYAVALRTRPFPDGFGRSLLGVIETPASPGALWYLYALFISSILVAALASNRYASWLVPASAVAVVFAGMLGLPNTAGIGSVAWIYPYVIVGYLVAKRPKPLIENRDWVMGMCVFAFLPMFYLRQPFMVSSLSILGRLAVANRDSSMFILINLVTFSCGIVASIFVFCLYAKKSGRWIDVQAWIGRRTLGIYAAETLLIDLMRAGGLHNPLLLLAGALAGSLLITLAVERIPFVSTLLLGRPLPQIAWPRPLAPGEENA